MSASAPAEVLSRRSELRTSVSSAWPCASSPMACPFCTAVSDMNRVLPLRSSSFRLGSEAATRVRSSRSESWFFWKSCEMRRA